MYIVIQLKGKQNIKDILLFNHYFAISVTNTIIAQKINFH